MKYCTRCIQPDTRPNTKFTVDGLCPACKYHESIEYVDWYERFDILKKLIKKYRQPMSQYDCIVGVSGGKDSTRQALWVRDKLDLKPLLVCLSYPPEQVSNRGCENISNLIDLGFDVVISGPSPQVWKTLMRKSFIKYSNWAKSTELALFSCVPQIAMKYNIPLIIWGENPALQLGDLKTLGKTGYDGNNIRHMNTLSGANIDWILEEGFDKNKINPYIYPSYGDFINNKIQIIYLGWFLKDWGLVNNGLYSSVNGLSIREESVNTTADLHGITSLDEDWVIVNQLIKYYKYGFGKVTDYCNEEIRLGKMSREEAIKIADKYDGKCSKKYINSFCKYIGISENFFWEIIFKNINRKLFYVDNTHAIKKFKVGIGLV